MKNKETIVFSSLALATLFSIAYRAISNHKVPASNKTEIENLQFNLDHYEAKYEIFWEDAVKLSRTAFLESEQGQELLRQINTPQKTLLDALNAYDSAEALFISDKLSQNPELIKALFEMQQADKEIKQTRHILDSLDDQETKRAKMLETPPYVRFKRNISSMFQKSR